MFQFRIVCINFRRRRYREDFADGPRRKRSRGDFERDGGIRSRFGGNRPRFGAFYKDRRMDRPPRYNTGVRRETFINGTYNDYIREFAHARPPPPMPGPYGPPPFPVEQMPPYPGHFDNRQPRESMPYPDYGQHQTTAVSRPRTSSDKRSYERDVDDFLRRTSHPVRRERSLSRERDRSRDRDRHRHRDRR